MRLSLSHGFLFVHIPRTAGLSVNALLDPYCIRPKRAPFRRLLSRLPVREDPRKAVLPVHATAPWMRIKLGSRFFDELYSFAFVRNPFDLVVSRYEYIRQQPRHHRHALVSAMSFAGFVEFETGRQARRQNDFGSFLLDRRGNSLVDEIYRFEALEEEIHRLCKRIGIKTPDQLPERHRTRRGPYREYYGEKERAAVARIYARDLELFGYEF